MVRAKPTHVYKPAEALARGGAEEQGVRWAVAGTQAGRFRNFSKFAVLFQEAGSRRVSTARAASSRLRALRSMQAYWFFSGIWARMRGARWGSAGRRPRGVTAPETVFQAASAVHAWCAPARCLVAGRVAPQPPWCVSIALPATWSVRRAKVPGQDALRAAAQGRRRVLRPCSRAVALRRAWPPTRREGLFACREKEVKSRWPRYQ